MGKSSIFPEDSQGFHGAKFNVYCDDEAIVITERETLWGEVEGAVRMYTLRKAELLEAEMSGWLAKQGYKLVKIESTEGVTPNE